MTAHQESGLNGDISRHEKARGLVRVAALFFFFFKRASRTRDLFIYALNSLRELIRRESRWWWWRRANRAAFLSPSSAVGCFMTRLGVYEGGGVPGRFFYHIVDRRRAAITRWNVLVVWGGMGARTISLVAPLSLSLGAHLGRTLSRSRPCCVMGFGHGRARVDFCFLSNLWSGCERTALRHYYTEQVCYKKKVDHFFLLQSVLHALHLRRIIHCAPPRKRERGGGNCFRMKLE